MDGVRVEKQPGIARLRIQVESVADILSLWGALLHCVWNCVKTLNNSPYFLGFAIEIALRNRPGFRCFHKKIKTGILTWESKASYINSCNCLVPAVWIVMDGMWVEKHHESRDFRFKLKVSPTSYGFEVRHCFDEIFICKGQKRSWVIL